MELILVGIISGMITGIGMGGGSVLILILVSFMQLSQQVAQATNFLFYIPTAVLAILMHIRKENIQKEIAKKLFFTSMMGSGIGALLTTLIKPESLRKYFGFFLLALRNKGNDIPDKRILDKEGERENNKVIFKSAFGKDEK